jgi:hypothetical protein
VAAAGDATRFIGHTKVVPSGYADARVENFFTQRKLHDNIVCNPPFTEKIERKFIQHALTRFKVAIIFQTSKINAARRLRNTPLRRVWWLDRALRCRPVATSRQATNPQRQIRFLLAGILRWAAPDRENLTGCIAMKDGRQLTPGT